MATEPTTIPRGGTDERGRPVRLTPDEVRARNEEAIRALDSLDDMGDEDEQRASLEALIAAIDREPLSDRRRFRG